MDAQRILFLLTKEENAKLDFKLKLSTDTESFKKELAKDVSAIANSRGGRGFILFGIEDKTKNIIGIDKNEFKEERIQQIISTRIDPPVPISVSVVSLGDKDIGVITIYTTGQKPHQIRDTGAFHIRRGSTTDIMRKDEIASSLEETGVVNHELLPVINATIDNLNKDKIQDYFKKIGITSPINYNLLIENSILMDEKDFTIPHPSFGSMLLFGINPELFLPHCVIKIHNSLNDKMPYHYIAKGTIIEMLEDTCFFIRQCLCDFNFPIEIIEEHLGKSVVYRDYFDINNCIEIYISKKCIEITNPGAALKGEENDKEKYVKRNMWLYQKVLTLDVSNRFLNKNYNSHFILKGNTKIKYINLVSKNIFKVIIPLSIKENTKREQ
jgi:ATP-dependent DNA helicase RecG